MMITMNSQIRPCRMIAPLLRGSQLLVAASGSAVSWR
jgi:hypothetical protein